MSLLPKTALSGLRQAGGPSSPLLTGLVAWWEVDEVSGQRNDSHLNSLHLTDTNTVGSRTGLVNPLAGDFIKANSEYLTRAVTTPDFSAGMTIAAWVNLDAPGASDYTFYNIFGMGNVFSPGESILFGIVRVPTGNQDYIQFDIPGSTGVAGDFVHAYHFGVGNTVGRWILIVGRLDLANDVAKTKVLGALSDGETSTAYTATAPYATLPRIDIGRSSQGGQYFDGAIGSVALWNRTLTDNEVTLLYSAGAGITYPG